MSSVQGEVLQHSLQYQVASLLTIIIMIIISDVIRSDSEYDSYPLPPPSLRAEGGLQEYLYTTRRCDKKN